MTPVTSVTCALYVYFFGRACALYLVQILLNCLLDLVFSFVLICAPVFDYCLCCGVSWMFILQRTSYIFTDVNVDVFQYTSE